MDMWKGVRSRTLATTRAPLQLQQPVAPPPVPAPAQPKKKKTYHHPCDYDVCSDIEDDDDDDDEEEEAVPPQPPSLFPRGRLNRHAKTEEPTATVATLMRTGVGKWLASVADAGMPAPPLPSRAAAARSPSSSPPKATPRPSPPPSPRSIPRRPPSPPERKRSPSPPPPSAAPPTPRYRAPSRTSTGAVVVFEDHEWRGGGYGKKQTTSTRFTVTPFFLVLCRHAVQFNNHNALLRLNRHEILAPALADGTLAQRLRTAPPEQWPHEILGVERGAPSDCALAVAVQFLLLFCFPLEAAAEDLPLALYEALEGRADSMNVLFKRLAALCARSASMWSAAASPHPPLLAITIAEAREMLAAASDATVVAAAAANKKRRGGGFFGAQDGEPPAAETEEDRKQTVVKAEDVEPDPMPAKQDTLPFVNEAVLRDAIARYRSRAAMPPWLLQFASLHAATLYSIRRRPTAHDIYTVFNDFLHEHGEHVGRAEGGGGYFSLSDEHVWLALSHLLAAVVRSSDTPPNDIDLELCFGHYSHH